VPTHETNKSLKLLLKIGLRFGKPEAKVSLGPAAVRGTVSTGESVLLPIKWHLTRGEMRSMTTEGVVAAASRSNRRKQKGQKN
jgi:hypothetical protein